MIEKWNSLFSELARVAQLEDPSNIDIAHLNTRLGAVGLIQPFNWVKWGAPFPELHELWHLNIHDCIRHITRIARAERTNEGVLRSAVRAGAIPIICLTAHKLTQGQHAPVLQDVVKI